MKIRFKDAIVNYENKETKEFRQYKIAGEPLMSKDTNRAYVDAVKLYDSIEGHILLKKPLMLDFLWMLENCDIYEEKIVIAETIEKNNPNSNEKQTIKVRYANNITEQILYHADPLCKHIIEPNAAGGIKCRRCGGWYCA